MWKIYQPTPQVEGFLALLAARRAPRTVEAYRRDLASLATWLDRPPHTVTTEELERYLAELRAQGLSGSTIARRAAAIRSFFRHLVLLGQRTDNPAAELELPRRSRRLPRTLSPGEAERLSRRRRHGPARLRDRALVELLYGAGLRVSEAVGLEQGRRRLRGAHRPLHRQGRTRSGSSPSAARRPRRYAATSRAAARYLDRRHRPELFLNAQGGPLTRAGAFLILRSSRPRPGSSRSASTRTS